MNLKKLLIGILIVLLVILVYFVMAKGITIGNIKILSIDQIITENDNLTKNIEEANSLLKKDYPSKKQELSNSVNTLLKQKEEYFNLAKVSTENEISKANTEETYLREYLWVRIGRKATSRGVWLKLDINTGDAGDENIKTLAFTAKGQYAQLIQFIASLEDDDKLGFKIENFKMTKNGSDLVATFKVRNVRIKGETATSNN